MFYLFTLGLDIISVHFVLIWSWSMPRGTWKVKHFMRLCLMWNIWEPLSYVCDNSLYLFEESWDWKVKIVFALSSIWYFYFLSNSCAMSSTCHIASVVRIVPLLCGKKKILILVCIWSFSNPPAVSMVTYANLAETLKTIELEAS